MALLIMIIALTSAVVPVYGHPLQLSLRITSITENPRPVDKLQNSTRNASLLYETNHADVLPMNMSSLENDTRTFSLRADSSKVVRISGGLDCPLPTCGTANIASSLQGGKEIAGSSTIDPYGPGKK